MLAIVANTHITGGNAQHFIIFAVEYLCSCKAWKDFNAKVLSLFGQPAAEFSEADNIVTMVVHGFRCKQIRHLNALGRTGKDKDIVFNNRSQQRGAHLFPLGEQLIEGRGFEDSTGKNMGSHFRAFLYYTDGNICIDLL